MKAQLLDEAKLRCVLVPLTPSCLPGCARLTPSYRHRGRVVTFHDRPPAAFRRQTDHEAHEVRLFPCARSPSFSMLTQRPLQLFRRLSVLSSIAFPPTTLRPLHPGSTFFTTPTGHLASPRPALLVSATSWTLDEDFSILLAALSTYERAAASLASGGEAAVPPVLRLAETGTRREKRLPPVVVLITGKGAGKKAFEREVERRERSEGWEWVRVRTAWLEREDYPRLLGASPSSLSFHSSALAGA